MTTPSSPIGPTQPPERGRPGLGSGEEAQPRPFSLPPEAPPKELQAVPTEGKPTPMEAMKISEGDARAKQQQLTPDQLQDRMRKLNEQLGSVKTKLQNPTIAKTLTPDHHLALTKTVDRLGTDIRTIAKNTNGEFVMPTKSKAQGALEYVTNFIDGSQNQLRNAIQYVGQLKNPTYAQMLSLQYSVQRATQKGELLSSIIGASTSAIKGILSTQLG